MTLALTEVSGFGKMRVILPLSVSWVQNIPIVMQNGMIVDAIALFLMALSLTALRFEKVAFDARTGKLQMSFFLGLSMLQEYKVLADQSQCPPEISNANDEVMLLTTEALIRHLNTLLAIIWLL
jgi:hypothetical protein